MHQDATRPIRPILVLWTLILASSAYLFTSLMIVPAFKVIGAELQTPPATISWLLTAPLVVGVIIPPIAGRFGDMFGKSRTLVVVLAIFAAGGIIGGIGAVSHSLWLVIAGRALQGFGAATLPLSFGIIADVFEPKRIGPSLSLLSSSFGVGAGIGLLAAGPIIENLSWDWLFWAGAIVVLAAFVASLLFLPLSATRTHGRVDWLGAVLLSCGLSALLLTVSATGNAAWHWTEIGQTAVLGAVLLAAFAWWEQRTKEPLVALALLRSPAAIATNFEAFVIGFVQFGSMAILPLLLMTPAGHGFGLAASATEAGLYMLPSMAAMVLIAPIGGYISLRFGAQLQLLLGAALLTISFLWFAFRHNTGADIYLANAIYGAGLGLALASIATLVIQSVDRTRTGVAAGLNTVFRMVGGAVGTQVMTALVTLETIAGTSMPAESGYATSFVLCAVASAMAGATALKVRRQRVAA